MTGAFGLAVEGKLSVTTKATNAALKRAATGAMRDTAPPIKARLQADIKRGFPHSVKFPNTWHVRVYPRSGDAADPALVISNNAGVLITVFSLGATIRGAHGNYLAIPMPDAGVMHTTVHNQRLTPAIWQTETGIKLKFVPRGDHALLVADQNYVRQPARWRRRTLATSRKPFKPIPAGLAAGQKIAVIFVLVRQVVLGKRIDAFAELKKIEAELPRNYVVRFDEYLDAELRGL